MHAYLEANRGMNFQFSNEQEALREQLQRLLKDGPARCRAVMAAGDNYDRALWKSCVEVGLTAAAIPEADGGLGLGVMELCVIAEEVGRALAPVPIASSVLYATEIIRRQGGEAATLWLPRLAAGEAIATVALTEGTGSWDTAPTAVVVDGKLSGSKLPVSDPHADVAIVSARSEQDGRGYGLWLAPLDHRSVVRRSVVVVDRIRRHAVVEFAATPVVRIGKPGEGANLVDGMMDSAAILTAFEQLGGAEAALLMTRDYALQRRAFGKPIGANQAVKHKLADMYARIELARGHCYYGAWALDVGSAELPRAAAGARLAATDAFVFAAEEAIQLHGGIGFTWESDCSLYLRRSRLLAQILGSRRRWTSRLVNAVVAA